MRDDDHARYSAPDFEYGHFHKHKADPLFCRWQVWPNDRAPTPYQCQRKHKPDSLWCKIHNPYYMKEKQRKWQENYQKEYRASTRRFARPRKIEEALRKIAEGDLNDPAGYAEMVLQEVDEP